MGLAGIGGLASARRFVIADLHFAVLPCCPIHFAKVPGSSRSRAHGCLVHGPVWQGMALPPDRADLRLGVQRKVRGIGADVAARRQNDLAAFCGIGPGKFAADVGTGTQNEDKGSKHLQTQSL